MAEQRRSAVLVKSIDHCSRSADAEGQKMVMGMNVYSVEEKERGGMLYRKVLHTLLEKWMSLGVV